MNVSSLNSPRVITRELKIKKNLDHVISFMTGAPQLGSWLSPVKSVDARAGGEIIFRAEAGFEHGAKYQVLDLPTHVVLLSDKFGQIDAKFDEDAGKTLVSFTFTKSGDDEFEKIVADTVTRFIAMVNY